MGEAPERPVEPSDPERAELPPTTLEYLEYLEAFEENAQAIVAAKLHEAAEVAGDAWTWPDADVSAVPCQNAIRALIDTDHQAALDAVRAEERERVWIRARKVICSKDWTDCDGDVFCDAIKSSIREAGHE